MASVTINGSPSSTTNTITVNFTTDVADISKVELSNDGGNTYINATSFTSSSAEFNITTWSNGSYDNCVLRLTYTENVNTRILSQLQYGKGWSNNAQSIVDNSACWSTVEAVQVKANQQYKISCDAAWLWIRSFDENDNLVATIATGSDSNPSQYTLTPTTGYIRTGCYDPDKKLTYFTLEEV